MIRSRWWALALGTLTLIEAAIIAASVASAGRAAVGYGVLAAVLVTWLLVGRRVADGNRWWLVWVVVVVTAAGALAAVHPSLALFQAIAMPSLWASAARRRDAILANVAVGLAVVAGYYLTLPLTTGTHLLVLLTSVASVGGSIALGLWIWRIAELSDERRALIEQLTAAQVELATLHRDAGVTAERERLAREVHDTVAQSLAGVVLLAQRARRDLEAGTLSGDTLAVVEDSARLALTETRSLVAAAAPVDLGGGLGAALETLAQRFRRESGIDVRVDIRLEAPLDRETDVVLLRTAQEGLANVRKHSGAAHATVTLRDRGDAVDVAIRDDGRGFDPDARVDGFGLAGLRDRLALAGGELEIDGTPGATTLRARVPRRAE